MKNKKIAIMQPYLFPYKGYFSLFSYCDTFIFLDDVNFINRGFINKNKILLNNSPYEFNIPLTKSSQNKKINEISTHNVNYFIKKKSKSILHAYKHKPYGENAYNLFINSINKKNKYISDIAISSIINTAEYLSISKEFFLSSKLKLPNYCGERRIIEICKKFEATEYVNLPGGKNLYNSNKFEKNSIQLSFLNIMNKPYNQGTNIFYPNLSILDLIANLSVENVIEQLKLFTISK